MTTCNPTSLTSQLVILAGKGIVAVAKVSDLQTETLEFSIQTHVVAVGILQLRGQLIHATLQLSSDLFGVLHALGELVSIGIGLSHAFAPLQQLSIV